MISSVEIITKDQLKEAALLIFHLHDDVGNDQAKEIKSGIEEKLSQAGYAGEVVVTFAFRTVETK